MALTILGRPPGKATGTLDDRLDGEFVDEWLIRTDDTAVSRQAVIACPGLPVLWERYVNAPGTYWHYFLVKEIDAKQSPDSPWLWAVTVRWSTRISEQDRQKLDPRDRPPFYKHSSQRATRAREYDDLGKALVNCAGLPFDPPHDGEESNLLLTVTRNEVLLNRPRDLDYYDSVNDAVWLDGLPGTWKCVTIEGSEGWERNTYFASYVYQFLYKRSGWTGYHQGGQVLHPDKTRILTRGKVERLNGKINWIYDMRGHAIPDPVCLDGRGLRLDPGPDRATKTTAIILAAGTTVTVENPYAIVQGQRSQIFSVPIAAAETVIVDKVDVATKTLTLVRAQDGTTAVDRPSGSTLYQKSGTSTQIVAGGGIAGFPAVLPGDTGTVVVNDALVFGFIRRIPGGAVPPEFPAYGITPFIRIDQEEMYVIGIGGPLQVNALTVSRGANGTTPAAHLAGAEVRQAPTFINFNLVKSRNFGALGL